MVIKKDKYKRKYPRNKSFPCAFCGVYIMRSNSTVDHLLPKNKLGCRHRHNRVRCCEKCNGDKTDKYLDDWFKEKGWEMSEDLMEQFKETLKCFAKTKIVNEEKIKELKISIR